MTLRPNLGGPSERLPQTGLVSSNATKLDIGQGGGQYSPQDRPLRRSMRLQTGRPSLPRSGRCRAKSRRLAAVDLVTEGRATSPKRRHEQSAAQEPDHKGKSNLSGTRPWSLEKLAAAADLHQNSTAPRHHLHQPVGHETMSVNIVMVIAAIPMKRLSSTAQIWICPRQQRWSMT